MLKPKSKVLYGSEGAPPTIVHAPTPVRVPAGATRAYACATRALHARARAYLTGAGVPVSGLWRARRLAVWGLA